jgi:hypothetical protein
VRGGSGGLDWLPGLSDVDLVLVLSPDPGGRGLAARRVTARWERLRRRVPSSELLVDWPRVHEEPQLRDLAGACAFTYGLDGPGGPGAAYSGPAAGPDVLRVLERPGLYGPTAGWRLVRGSDRRPPDPARSSQLRRLAAWLELQHWWQWAFPVCVDPTGPRTAALCVKLVAEPARCWLWLAHGERATDRADVLGRALRRLPEEEDGLRRALDLQRALPDSPPAPLEAVLPLLVRLSTRIARLLAAGVDEAGATEVRLAGTGADRVVLARGRFAAGEPPPDPTSLLPLADWRGLVLPHLPDDSFAPLAGDPADPAVIARAAGGHQSGPYPALRAGELMVFPAVLRSRTRLRAIQCALTDPGSFALAAGAPVARFPDVPGWSAADTARRAVAEHRVRLGTPGVGGEALAVLLSAARAALFQESLEAGDP